MADTTNNPPIETHRDGAVSAKIWRNITKDGNPSYSVTFQRTYTDPATQRAAESRSFWSTDILKVQQLAEKSYQTIGKMREMDKSVRTQSAQQEMYPSEQQPAQKPTDVPQQGLVQQRDAAMENAQPAQKLPPEQHPTLER